jgi:hypothetical protein
VSRAQPEIDTHFYIDNAPPEEVLWVLRCLDDTPLKPAQISERGSDAGYVMQSDQTYSPRRLYDLGLLQTPESGARTQYIVSSAGRKIRQEYLEGTGLFWDLMHYFHYTKWDGQPHTRKLLWSYRTCCEILWNEKALLPTSAMAARVQAEMQRNFDLDFLARKGARFDSSAAGRCYNWVGCLMPSAFPQKTLQPRVVDHYKLSLLALDHVYRLRGYRYGDPVILDDALLDEIARVFFLEPVCCRELLDLAARVTRAIALRDTFAGTSIKLLAPYGVMDI